MKGVRNFVYVSAMVVLMILLWGTTPPESSESSPTSFVVRGAISLLMLYLGFFAERRLLEKVANTCASAAKCALEKLCEVMESFLEWAATVSLKDVEVARDKIEDDCKWKEGKEKKAINRPIRVLCRWTDFMQMFLSVALVCAAGWALHYRQSAVVVALNLLGLMSYIFLAVVVASVEIKDPSAHVATEVTCGVTCLFFQEVALVVQLVMAVFQAFQSGEIQTSALYEPYFTVQLDGLNFTLSPIQMIILVSAMLMLICFANLCSNMHALVYPSDDEEAEEG